MTGRSRDRRAAILGVAALLAAGALSGCLDMALVADIAFPPTMPGLADPRFVSLPVGRWVTEGATSARGIAGCLAPGCDPGLAVGLFQASGADADALARTADDPDALARALMQDRPPEKRPRARVRNGAVSRPRVPVVASSERIREGAWRGFVLRIARADGSQPAFGTALVRTGPRGLTAILVIGLSEGATRRVARAVAAEAG